LTVERAYFDWGRGSTADSSEPNWGTAPPDLRRVITLRGYSLYDGWPPLPGDQIGPLEAYVSVGVNSRVILNDVVRFLVRAEAARPLFTEVPDHVRLEDAADSQIAAAGALIDLFTEASYIGLSKATKVLHKKRPNFIPIFDSVVADFLWKNFPHVLKEGSSTESLLHLFRRLLVARAQPLGCIRAALEERGFRLSSVRLLDFLIWSGWYQHFGQPFTQVWETASVSDARSKARQAWEASKTG
jgi:hypothetical protein